MTTRTPTPPDDPKPLPHAAATAADGVVRPAALPAPGGPAAQRRLPSGELFRGAQEVEIVHHEQVYRLRQTALGKLILTK